MNCVGRIPVQSSQVLNRCSQLSVRDRECGSPPFKTPCAAFSKSSSERLSAYHSACVDEARELPMPISGLVAIDRSAMFGRWRGRLEGRSSCVNMTNEQIFDSYQGIDGDVWPSPPFADWEETGILPLTEWESVTALVNGASRRDTIDVVALVRGPTAADDLLHTGWRFLGCDIGYLESKWSHLSAVLHEVVFGIHPSLTRFSSALNANLLLDTVEAAIALLQARTVFASGGGDVEMVGEMSILGVFRKVV